MLQVLSNNKTSLFSFSLQNIYISKIIDKEDSNYYIRYVYGANIFNIEDYTHFSYDIILNYFDTEPTNFKQFEFKSKVLDINH